MKGKELFSACTVWDFKISEIEMKCVILTQIK